MHDLRPIQLLLFLVGYSLYVFTFQTRDLQNFLLSNYMCIGDSEDNFLSLSPGISPRTECNIWLQIQRIRQESPSLLCSFSKAYMYKLHFGSCIFTPFFSHIFYLLSTLDFCLNLSGSGFTVSVWL